MARATYAEIAEHAGVSTATVSRVLSGRDYVRPELADRVRASATALGYRQNRAARTLRTQRADAIGLVLSDVENPFFASVARAVEAVASARDHAVLLCNTDEHIERESAHLDLMIAERVAGVIVAPATEDPAALSQLTEERVPTVLVDRRADGDPFDSVLIDHRTGARDLTGHMLGHGHRHIAVVMGTTEGTPSRERLTGCREAVARHPDARLTVLEGRPADAIGTAGTLELGRRLVLDLAGRDTAGPTAVFCANNLLMQGCLYALRESGLRVPDDIALCGFDDQPMFDLVEPPLTVAAQPTEAIGRTAAELLFDRIARPDGERRVHVLDPELRIRRSCGCP
ncbi:LacI family DNA-binding transcriptional regulator [Nocardiopsis aegyptia]|uniref:LacI family DNA-binding transcriptional regulator n=1 Tax=Nocardiopsis aegyptia TaxID=220378 RepID=UPI00366D5F1C